jgi:5-methylcytosine-specific restriction endonuclease McrA
VVVNVGRICPGCFEIIYGPCSCGYQPARLRLRRQVYDDPRWRRFTRWRVLERDDHRCRICGGPGQVVDHVVPVAELVAAGRDPFSPDECQTLCRRCSGRKDGRRSRS